MINFGRFKLEKVIIIKAEESQFNPLEAGGNTFNIFVKKSGEEETENIFVITKHYLNFDELISKRIPLNIEGSILKNPNTHKQIYFSSKEDLIQAS